MMDHKELIERTRCPDSVRGCKYLGLYDFSCKKCREQTMKDCTAAIETLLAERDAILYDLAKWSSCCLCVHSAFNNGSEGKERCKFAEDCDHPRKHWQWRGPTPPDYK